MESQAKPNDQTIDDAYAYYHANSYGYSEYQEEDFKAGFNVGYNKGYQEAVNGLDQSRGAYKERMKRYFVSFSGVSESGNSIVGCSILSFKNKSLKEITEEIKAKNNMQSQCVILNLRELSEDEFQMLTTETIQQQ